MKQICSRSSPMLCWDSNKPSSRATSSGCSGLCGSTRCRPYAASCRCLWTNSDSGPSPSCVAGRTRLTHSYKPSVTLDYIQHTMNFADSESCVQFLTTVGCILNQEKGVLMLKESK